MLPPSEIKIQAKTPSEEPTGLITNAATTTSTVNPTKKRVMILNPKESSNQKRDVKKQKGKATNKKTKNGAKK